MNRPLVQTVNKAPSRRFSAKEKKGSSSSPAKRISTTKTYKLVMDRSNKEGFVTEKEPVKESLATVKKLNERIDLLEMMINSRFEQVHDNQE